MQLPVQTRLYAICRYLGYALLSRYRTKVSPGSFVSIGGFMVRIILNWHAIFRSIRWLILTLFNFTVWVRELIFIEPMLFAECQTKGNRSFCRYDTGVITACIAIPVFREIFSLNDDAHGAAAVVISLVSSLVASFVSCSLSMHGCMFSDRREQ